MEGELEEDAARDPAATLFRSRVVNGIASYVVRFMSLVCCCIILLWQAYCIYGLRARVMRIPAGVL